MKTPKLHALILAVVFLVVWFVFAHGPVTAVFEHSARPRFAAPPDESSEGATPAAAFRRAVADPDGPPIHVREVPFTSIMVLGPKGRNGEIVPMLYQGLGFTGPVESYYAADGTVKWRTPARTEKRP